MNQKILPSSFHPSSFIPHPFFARRQAMRSVVKIPCPKCGVYRQLRMRLNGGSDLQAARKRLCQSCAKRHCFYGGPRCRHCGIYKRGRCRGLCYYCYRDPAIRALYPSSHSKHARHGLGTRIGGGYTLPAAPTCARPGSDEKIAILSARAAANTALFHPADAGWEGMKDEG